MKERLNVDAVRKLGQLSGRNNIGSLNADASESASGAAASDGQDDAEKSRALDRALILAHAKSSGMQSRPDVDRALQVAHETTLIDAYIDDFLARCPLMKMISAPRMHGSNPSSGQPNIF